MKGKTGKMKGGGLARRGVGAALASGGMARGTPKSLGDSRIASKPGMGVGSRPVSGMTRPGFPSGGVTRPGMPGPIVRRAGGGPVKMTAGAGSGSGRLEKVANHKKSKRIPAANLKSGGKVKGK